MKPLPHNVIYIARRHPGNPHLTKQQALAAHHSLMQAAVKTKQVVDVAACDALDHAIADVGAMYTKK